MTLILAWNFIQRFWIPLVIAGLFAFGATWHYFAVRSAVKANNVAWESKNKANEIAWLARIKAADNATKANEIKFKISLTTINNQRAKEKANGQITLDNALRLAKSSGMYDPGSVQRCSVTSQVETGAIAGMGAYDARRQLSDEFGEMLLKEASRADEITLESNYVKKLLVSVYKSCVN